MRTALNIIGSLILVSIIVVGGGIMALPYFLSTDLVKTKVAQLVEQKTGRKLSIGGKTSFKLFPNIAVSLDDISLSNPSGMKGAPLVKMSSLRSNLKLMPLFKGRTEVDGLTLINPVFDLQVDKKGRKNWDFNEGKSSKGNDDSGGTSSSGQNFSLGTVTIKNGSVRYSDAGSGFDKKVEAINIEVLQKPSDRSIATKGNLRWQNEILHITSLVANPDDLIAGKASNVAFNVKSRLTNADYQGSVEPGDQPAIDGFLILDTSSVRKLATFLGQQLPPGKGFGKLKLKTKIKGNANGMEYTTEQFLFDNMELTSNGSVELKKARPFITANLQADRLDLNPYLGSEKSKSSTRALGSRGKAADTPIDLSGLKAIDGRFTIKTKEILYQKARLGAGDFKIGVNNGRANVDIETLSLYRGTARGKFVLDGSGSTNVIGGNLALKDVLTGALLRDFAGFDKLAGKGNISGDFNGKGNSLNALKGSLKGKMNIALLKGRFEGFDLAKYVSTMTGNKVPGSVGGRGKPMTAYEKMSGLLKFNKGVARNKDFLLTGKYFRVRAAGSIDLVRESLRLRIAPKLFSGDWSFAPPLRVIGNWLKPKVKFDALAFLGGGQGIMRSLDGLASGKVDVGSALQTRGLQTDAEIEAYLKGQKIDASTAPANDNVSGDGQTSGGDNAGGVTGSNSPVGKLLGGDKKAADKLLKKLFQ